MASVYHVTGSTTDTTKPTDTKSSTDNAALDKQAFLQLLIAQLKNQDPMSPMDNSQFVAQLAQFSSLEQMGNMATAIDELKESMVTLNSQSLLTQGAAMIGKEVVGQITTDGETEKITGTISSVKWSEGSLTLMIGDQALGMEDILEIREAGTADLFTE
ncbi:MAG: flagellar biosynthesis protein FlgD [Dehalobacter sp.]|nr:flagellar biosynthesis protein FlgD [Dehalobacter sp.]